MGMNVNYLKARKKSLKLTNEDVSARSGIPVGTLNKIFAGQTEDPKFETVRLLCDALEISLSELEAADSSSSIEDPLTPFEYDIIRSIRALNEESRDFVISILERECQRNGLGGISSSEV